MAEMHQAGFHASSVEIRGKSEPGNTLKSFIGSYHVLLRGLKECSLGRISCSWHFIRSHFVASGFIMPLKTIGRERLSKMQHWVFLNAKEDPFQSLGYFSWCSDHYCCFCVCVPVLRSALVRPELGLGQWGSARTEHTASPQRRGRHRPQTYF